MQGLKLILHSEVAPEVKYSFGDIPFIYWFLSDFCSGIGDILYPLMSTYLYLLYNQYVVVF